MRENSSFISFDGATSGLIFDQASHKEYPLSYYHIINGKGLDRVDLKSSYYFYCYEGEVIIDRFGSGGSMYIGKHMYGSVSGDWSINPFALGKAIVIRVFHERALYPRTKFRAVDMVGGPIEEEGRLKYIDGCTDSLLIPPVKMGDPCLNHLHFPSGIDQTPHTHPSHRIGIVAKGHGECVTPFGNLPLTEGMIFVIKEWDGSSYDTGKDGNMHPTGTHKFKTFDEAMDVIAFHPDSDFGATDVDHPMINRTIVDGVSANSIDEIRTK
jgi:hypothetical protein